MKNIFKEGEKVFLKGGSPCMYVLRQVEISNQDSNFCVECWWYDDKMGYLTAIFHQSELISSQVYSASQNAHINQKANLRVGQSILK